MTELQMVWGWQPALYLFLGGMGAGAFVVAAVQYFYDREASKRTFCAASWAAAICLGVGLLLLLSELTNPLRGLMLWQSFSHFTSWMTVGAWAVLAALVVFGLEALATTPLVIRWLKRGSDSEPRWLAKLRTVLAALGIVLGLVVAAYTGILLMSAPGVPLWNTLLLPCLFTVSALDTGVALVEIISSVTAKRAEARGEAGESAKSVRLFRLGTMALVVLEVIALAALLGGALGGAGSPDAQAAVAAQSATILTSGVLAVPFWVLVALCGLGLPFLFAALCLAVRKRWTEGVALLGAIGVLAGGCALRFLVLMAGLHVDVVADSIGRLVM